MTHIYQKPSVVVVGFFFKWSHLPDNNQLPATSPWSSHHHRQTLNRLLE